MSSGAKNPSSVPSFIDLHIHGAFGVDVLTASDAEMDRLAAGLFARSVAGFLPTLVPLPLPEMAAAVARLSAWMRTRREGDGRGAMPLGLHFEGPFVSPSRCGALHRADFLDGHMRAAGAATPLFDAQATATLFHHSRGIPRLVQNLALASAMAAMAAGATQIDQTIVQQAVVDLEDL